MKLFSIVVCLFIVGSVVTVYQITKADTPKKEGVVLKDFYENAKTYPKNQIFSDELQTEANRIRENAELNEQPTRDQTLLNDPTVTEAIDVQKDFYEKLKTYPKNQVLSDELQKEANRIRENTELNEEPTRDQTLLNDPTVAEAIDYLVRTDKEKSHKILLYMPYGELVHYITFQKGFYPQELLNEAVETHAPILHSIKAMSESEALIKIIDETETKMREAAKNGDAFGYLQAWNKIDIIKETAGNRLRDNVK
ncbi:MAG TPA: hypothetical protein VGI04_03400 [Neobacillus sp.]